MSSEIIGLGTAVNAGAIIIGGLAGLTVSHHLTQKIELRLRTFLAALTVWVGLSLTWKSFHGGLGACARQFLVLLVSLMLGNALGRLLGLQTGLNQLGAFVKKRLPTGAAPAASRFSDGFVSGAIVFCLVPLAIVGAAVDGLGGNYRPLAIKAAIDGLAAVGFTAMFGWSVLLAVIPVVAYQGAITLLGATLAPLLDPDQLESINAVAGLLVFCVALIMLQLKRVALADYLPSLVIAPVLTWALNRLFL